MVTAEQWDLSPAWRQLLNGRGRLVVPLRIRGGTHVVAFKPGNGCLRSVASRFYRAVPLDVTDQLGQRREHGERCDVLTVAGRRPVLIWDSDQRINPTELGQSLVPNAGNRTWTGVTVKSGDDLGALWLRLAARELGACGFAGNAGEQLAPWRSPTAAPGSWKSPTSRI
ncbi:hypothetical protein [Amycolatopsis sp. lyj-112]|uniref:hypothetical protein n=1 Tax=Amycolatopsis sp. lyj-112 TaxID=2789288 RepID=UPI00397E19CE